MKSFAIQTKDLSSKEIDVLKKFSEVMEATRKMRVHKPFGIPENQAQGSIRWFWYRGNWYAWDNNPGGATQVTSIPDFVYNIIKNHNNPLNLMTL